MSCFGSAGASATRSPFRSQYALSRSPRGQSACALAAPAPMTVSAAMQPASLVIERSMLLSSGQPPRRAFAFRPLAGALFAPLFTSVFDPGGLVDLADHGPVLLEGDRQEAVLFLELLLQRGAFPGEGEERLLDLLDQLRVEVVGIAVARGREGF